MNVFPSVVSMFVLMKLQLHCHFWIWLFLSMVKMSDTRLFSVQLEGPGLLPQVHHRSMPFICTFFF